MNYQHTLNYKNELPARDVCKKTNGALGALLFALGLPGGTPRVKMSFPLGTCDKNWNTWKNMEIKESIYSGKTNEIINIFEPVLARNGKRVKYRTPA